ncbi:uncharacterized protein LOC111987554 [Quercus suber]|uniref:uncharacterized protein LOC111987554 n=1 Tax=Quercus suber TaxID=58331 RepID=UPI0032DFE1B0
MRRLLKTIQHTLLSMLATFPMSIMVRKTRANKKTSTFSTPVFQSEKFRTQKHQENYEKLYIFRSVWVEHKVILDEVDLKIRRNFERRGWLPLLEVEHPLLASLIREFYSNLSVNSNDSNTQYVRSWIRGEEYVITSKVVASALGVPLVQQLVYPYNEIPPLDDIMSLITSTSIRWSSDPHITTHQLIELNYLFFQISCHSIWPIFHLHTIPIERCAFLYALVTDAPMSFPNLFIRSLVKVHRSSSKSHGLFFPIFIHRILLDLSLEDFLAFEPVHILAPIGATFLRQRATQLNASSKHSRVESSTGVASMPPSGDPTTEEYVDPTVAVDPPPSSLSDSSIWSMLDIVMTIQAAYGQFLLDVLNELHALRVDLAGALDSTQ